MLIIIVLTTTDYQINTMLHKNHSLALQTIDESLTQLYTTQVDLIFIASLT